MKVNVYEYLRIYYDGLCGIVKFGVVIKGELFRSIEIK